MIPEPADVSFLPIDSVKRIIIWIIFIVPEIPSLGGENEVLLYLHLRNWDPEERTLRYCLYFMEKDVTFAHNDFRMAQNM